MTTTAGAQQLRLPRCGGRRADRHPRAHLFATMTLLGAAEERALAPLEDEELIGTDQEWDALNAEFDRCLLQTQTFYLLVIAPVYRSWWLH